VGSVASDRSVNIRGLRGLQVCLRQWLEKIALDYLEVNR
jgi:hypothetical protein